MLFLGFPVTSCLSSKCHYFRSWRHENQRHGECMRSKVLSRSLTRHPAWYCQKSKHLLPVSLETRLPLTWKFKCLTLQFSDIGKFDAEYKFWERTSRLSFFVLNFQVIPGLIMKIICLCITLLMVTVWGSVTLDFTTLASVYSGSVDH